MRRADPACSCGALSDDTLQASESTEVEPTSRPARRLEQRRSEREDIMKASILLCCTPLLFAASCAISTEGEVGEVPEEVVVDEDRKSTRLNSSHGYISYAVFCL